MWCRPLPPPAIDLILFFFTRPLHSNSTVENVSRYLVRVAVYLRVKLSDVVLNPSTILTTSLHHWVDRFTQQYVRVQKKWNPLNFLVLGGGNACSLTWTSHRTVYDYSPFRIWNWLNSFFFILIDHRRFFLLGGSLTQRTRCRCIVAGFYICHAREHESERRDLMKIAFHVKSFTASLKSRMRHSISRLVR